MRQKTVKAEWDADDGVWYVAESDVPGLAAEAASVEELVVKLRVLVPELVEANAHLLPQDAGLELPVRIMVERVEHMALAG